MSEATKNKAFPYEKINLTLSILGFIGSMVFYYHSIQKMSQASAESKQIEQLKAENERLRLMLSKNQIQQK